MKKDSLIPILVVGAIMVLLLLVMKQGEVVEVPVMSGESLSRLQHAPLGSTPALSKPTPIFIGPPVKSPSKPTPIFIGPPVVEPTREEIRPPDSGPKSTPAPVGPPTRGRKTGGVQTIPTMLRPPVSFQAFLPKFHRFIPKMRG